MALKLYMVVVLAKTEEHFWYPRVDSVWVTKSGAERRLFEVAPNMEVTSDGFAEQRPPRQEDFDTIAEFAAAYEEWGTSRIAGHIEEILAADG